MFAVHFQFEEILATQYISYSISNLPFCAHSHPFIHSKWYCVKSTKPSNCYTLLKFNLFTLYLILLIRDIVNSLCASTIKLSSMHWVAIRQVDIVPRFIHCIHAIVDQS